MKAVAVFPRAREVKVIDHPEPTIASPTQVKIRMIEVGICGTDREIWNFEYGTPPPGSDYLITGHESLGRVVEVGAQVKTVKVGDYVVPTVRRACAERCIACEKMRPDFCFTGHYTERGIQQAHGFMSEWVVEEESYLNAVPPALADVAVLLEPLTITEKALLETYLIQSRLPWECRIEHGATDKSCRNALVLGAGPVGILAAMAFRNHGMKTYVAARTPKPNSKAALVESIGAEYLSAEEMTPQAIAQHIGNVDVILEATGAAKAPFDFLQVLGTNGIFIFTSVPSPKKVITLDAGTLMRNIVLKNQAVLGTVNAPKQAFENGVQELQEFRKKWPQQLRAMITGKLHIARFQEARADGSTLLAVLSLSKSRQANEIKTVLTFDGAYP